MNNCYNNALNLLALVLDHPLIMVIMIMVIASISIQARLMLVIVIISSVIIIMLNLIITYQIIAIHVFGMIIIGIKIKQ